MYAKYGSYSHAAGEINLVRIQRRSLYSPRNQQFLRRDTFFLRGEIRADGSLTDIGDIQDDINTKITALEVAYQFDGQDFVFVMDTTPEANSVHIIDSSQTIGGTVVQQRPSYPVGSPCEFSNKRTYEIILYGDYPEVESQIYSVDESFEFIGTTGAQRQWINFIDVDPEIFEVWPQSFQMIYQRGRAIGVDGYYGLYGPAFVEGANIIEHVDRRRITLSTPQSYRNDYILYPNSWLYVFESRTAQSGAPTPV